MCQISQVKERNCLTGNLFFSRDGFSASTSDQVMNQSAAGLIRHWQLPARIHIPAMYSTCFECFLDYH